MPACTHSTDRISDCYQRVKQALLAERNAAGHWVGELSTSALSTATAVMALYQYQQNAPEADARLYSAKCEPLIRDGLHWLAEHQNSDGGWGDTTKSLSNISTTMLVHAVFHLAKLDDRFTENHAARIDTAQQYIQQAGGVPALIQRYGKDKTFSVPILTHCALAGLVSWNEVTALPFELATIPARFYKTVRLPVVSYALPALIAIGQVKHHFCPSWNPLLRRIRNGARKPSLRVLKQIQPGHGGFLEATPLTSFVTMSLAAMGLTAHPVTQKGIQFIIDSVRDDGSWPIDTNLATWVTTLSVNALDADFPKADQQPILNWLLDQQYREVHPYTNADPGGWAWTPLPGGVPDADDTPGAIIAILNLSRDHDVLNETTKQSLWAAVHWLLGLQNRDGGWPTFCRGWGNLPFDRSSADITAHVLRALKAASAYVQHDRIEQACENGFRFLDKAQRGDGSWLPLWFGNQFVDDDANPTYGTTRVLAAYRDFDRQHAPQAEAGVRWLLQNQNEDGGWGGSLGVTASIEETALAVEILLSICPEEPVLQRGLGWLMEQVESNQFTETTPIGFYFAKLWYFEKLYPYVFITAAFRRAKETFCMVEC